MRTENAAVDGVLVSSRDEILEEWLAEVSSAGSGESAASRGEADKFLAAFQEGIRRDGDASTFESSCWAKLREVLADLSESSAARGVSAGSTSHFVQSLKKPLFSRLQKHLGAEPDKLVTALWAVSTLVDKMAQLTVNTYQRSRENIIARQQAELLELSTPVVKLWEGVLAVPMIGTLDSNRTQLVMESLLQRIVETGSELAIIDITGVPTVDTLVAQHLLKTVTAIRLMGADCIISGIRPQIAQTIVHLGIDLQGVQTKATLADALALAMKKGGFQVTRSKA
ncbi:MAG: STAS domain-containing protein [Methylibium sp.]|uniref:STAS domain-containing protein n=1 Tax=Methylibium sp. TaxID=2067992 RepID=UPI0017FCF728|nr:STAS domain-containing protein [Methylibium sp.]MBA3596817.1 STAS domain-containing protein [Methylibium sp.]